jgi:hypothetical protein
MWYKNKIGNIYLLTNLVSLEKTSSSFYSIRAKRIYAGEVHSDEIEHNLETIESTDFIEWLIQMIQLEKWKVSWDDFLEYKAIVLKKSSDEAKKEENV